MARPKKDDKPQDNAQAQISVEAFKRNRDAVVAGLTSLQNSIGILLRAYLQDSNRLLGYDLSAGLDAASFDSLLNSAVSGFGAAAGQPATASAEDVKPKRKKRAKKEVDPNAPKRPLTAYFLYAQHARPIIKRDLEKEIGADLKPQMIANEATRRWKELPEATRQQWKESYEKNYEEYKRVMAEYRASKGLPHSPIPDPEDADEVPDEAAVAAVIGAEQEDAETDDDTDDEEEEQQQQAPPPSPPPKASSPAPVKTPKANKRRKTTKENGDAAAAPATSPTPAAVSTTRVPLPSETSAAETSSQAQKSPERKRKKQAKEASPEEQRKKKSRKSKGGEEVAGAGEAQPAATPAAAGEKKEKKSRKRKSEAAA